MEGNLQKRVIDEEKINWLNGIERWDAFLSDVTK
jgi:hypothetical protein